MIPRHCDQVNLLLGEALFVVRVVDGFGHGDTFTKSATLTLVDRTLVVDFLYSPTCHLINSFVELLVNLTNENDVLSHAVNLRLANLLLPNEATR